MRGAGVFIGALQVVHHGEVIALALLPVHGEGVGDVNGGVDVGRGIGRDHASEQRTFQSPGQLGGLAESLEVLDLGVAEKLFSGFSRLPKTSLGVSPRFPDFLVRKEQS